MANKKMISCRVCGKLFEPCSICQKHNDIFRWRNFACSRECAEKYIAETIAYRNSSKEDNNSSNSVANDTVTVKSNIVTTVDVQEEKSNTTKRKYNKKKSEEREQID